jgi:hypothetical protein
MLSLEIISKLSDPDPYRTNSLAMFMLCCISLISSDSFDVLAAPALHFLSLDVI